MNPVPKGLNAAGMSQLSCSGASCPQISVQTGAGTIVTSASDYAASFLATGPDDAASAAAWLIFSAAVLRLMILILMRIQHTSTRSNLMRI